MARGTETGSTPDGEATARSAAETEIAKFERLDGLVRTLVERFHSLQAEHAQTRARLAERDEQVRELNQRRQDAGKRLDDVLARLEQLDAEFERRLTIPSDEGS